MTTIFAVSSGRPPAAIAVIRVSGSQAIAGIAQLAGPLPPPRKASLRSLRGGKGQLLDQALVIHFPGPNTATGEDLVELHCHGGRAVVAAVEGELARLQDFRPAEPGEFTRRALMNGRIDLAEAEGLADLLQADTEAQRVAAMSTVEGRVSGAVRGWMARIATLSARAEAVLDFSDEDDVVEDPALAERLARAMQALGADIAQALSTPAVDRLRDGIRVVVAGPPNSGKSTLLNLMSERDVAIVSPIAGTTRDRIEVAVARAGLPYLLTDTAGLREETSDTIEQVGIARARQAVDSADILVWLADEEPPRADAIWVHSRADLPDRMNLPEGRALLTRADDPATVDQLWSLIEDKSQKLVPRSDQLALADRQRRLCQRSLDALRQPWSDWLVGAELLRQAHEPLAELLGQNATEAMLDTLFGNFCIGK